MNLVVLGATGRTGRLVVDQALAAGHAVTRADVAAWMIQAATTGQHSRNGVGVTGATRTVETSRTDPNPSGIEAATAAIRRIA